MRLRAAIAVALALSASAARATDAPMAFDETIVEVRLNDQTDTTTLIMRRDSDGTFLLRAEDLAALRLKTPGQGTVLVNGERYYRLDAALGAQSDYDEQSQLLNLHLPAAAFVPTAASLDRQTLPKPSPATGGFLNYQVSVERGSNADSTGAYLESGVFWKQGVVTSTLIANDGELGNGVVRLDTTWTRDFPEQLATLRVGDSITAPGAWGQAMRFAGVQFGTNFATQPTLITAPLLSASGEAAVPSTVDVFINGQRVANQSVPPGPFTIDNLPAISGAGQMQVVVTDALGRQQVVSQPYYSGPTLLRGGLAEYSAELGTVRRDYTLRSASYGDVVAAGTYRYGFNDQFTGEVHAEAQAGGAHALGFDAGFQVGTYGVLSANLAGGGDGDGTGWRSGLGFEHRGNGFSVFARGEFASERFAMLGTSEDRERMRSRLFAGVGYDLRQRGSLQLAFGSQTSWNAEDVKTVGLSYSVGLGRYGYLALFANHSSSDHSHTDAMLSWTMALGDRRTVSSSLGTQADAKGRQRVEATASLQKSLPAGDGTGYRVYSSSSEDYQLGYSLQGRAGRVNLDYAHRNDQDGWRLDGTGGLAFTGAGVMPGRWISESFAVIQVDDYAGMTVFLENQPVGRTDKKGRVLLDDLRPYETNKVSIDPLQLPIEASIDTAAIEVTPGYRSGPWVQFPARHSRGASLRLQLPDGSPVPAGAAVNVDGQSYPVALGGLVFIEEVGDSGIARVEWQGQGCDIVVDRPDDPDEPLPDLGTVACVPMAK